MQDPIPIPIHDVFDLHSVPPRDVRPVVEEYLQLAHDKGFSCVRIIHGRGIGVQRQAIREILAGTPFVVSFTDAPAEAGGWGATVVTFLSADKAAPIGEDLTKLQAEYDQVLLDAQALVAHLSRLQFNRQPQTGQWSIGQCLEHLNKVDGMYVDVIGQAVANGRRQGMFSPGPFRYPLLPSYLLKITEPPPKFRVPAPKAFRPAADLDPEETLREFRDCNRGLARLTGEAEGLDLQRITVPSPVAPWWKWPIGIVLKMCAGHDRRHLYQVRQVKARIA